MNRDALSKKIDPFKNGTIDVVERYLVLLAPFVIVGGVLLWFFYGTAWAFDVAGVWAIIVNALFSFRMTRHMSFQMRAHHPKRAIFFGCIGVPLAINLILTAWMGKANIPFPAFFPRFWYQVTSFVVAFALCLLFYRWYFDKEHAVFRKTKEVSNETGPGSIHA